MPSVPFQKPTLVVTKQPRALQIYEVVQRPRREPAQAGASLSASYPFDKLRPNTEDSFEIKNNNLAEMNIARSSARAAARRRGMKLETRRDGETFNLIVWRTA